MNEPDPVPAFAASEKWAPYRHPQPKESPPELVVPDAIPTDERIWVPVEQNVWFRPLRLAASRGYWMNLLKVKKAGVLSRHRHPQPVHAFVLKGEWRYLEHDWVARGAPTPTRRRARPTRSSSTRTSRR
jgi:2,4'-dihydroxyacetophenone dioxygenase